MTDTLIGILGIAGCIAMLWGASRIEPHWVSKDGRRFVCRVQTLGAHDLPDGPWREIRAFVDGASLVIGSRSRRAKRLSGVYRVAGRAPESPGNKAFFVLQGEARLLLRIPAKSRATNTLDSLITAH